MTPNDDLAARLSAFGIGGIVTPNGSADWVLRDEFFKILDLATDKLGISYIDSARAYELSEEAIGAWLKTKSITYKRELVFGSKCSISTFTNANGVAAHIENEIDVSLKTMGVEKIDIYWLHATHRAVPFETVIESFHRAQTAGKIRAYGISNVSAPELKTILQLSQANAWAKPFAVQNQYNLIVAAEEKQMVELCARNELLYFAYSPLASGLLAGRYPSKDELPEGSRWKTWSSARGLPAHWTEKTFADIDKLKALATELRATPSAVALAWCLRQPAVSVTLLGPRKAEHLEAARQALSLKLKSPHISLLDSLFR